MSRASAATTPAAARPRPAAPARPSWTPPNGSSSKAATPPPPSPRSQARPACRWRPSTRRSAASDPDMAALFEASNDTRDERARHHARFLKERGYLRQGVTLAEATDILWTCTSPELYDLLVQQRGWSLPRFARFLADYMIATLLPGERDRG